MTQHSHPQFVDGCYRCDLSRDELRVTFDPSDPAVIERAARAAFDVLEGGRGMPPVGGSSWHHIWRSGYNETKETD